MELIDEAVASGARRQAAAKLLGLDVRTLQRWEKQGADAEDQRRGPSRPPANKLSDHERQQVLDVLNQPEYRDLPPHQVVPRLLDEEGRYIASESTMYRILREEDMAAHRGRTRPATSKRPQAYEASGPSQVWTWDITYLPGPVRGTFFYAYMIMDVWSRKIVGARVFPEETMHHAARLFEDTCHQLHLDPEGLVLHADNGGPMKGATMLATLQKLGVVASFSRPHVSDDNPYSEALFRTMKYRPDYPSSPFASHEAAASWVEQFVFWYNTEHRHSGIRWVTPEERHQGRDHAILEQRHTLYQIAQKRHPERWTRGTRNWTPIETVTLNPATSEAVSSKEAA